MKAPVVRASRAYLIEVDDTKQGVCSPAVVGPFDDAETASRFAEEMRMGMSAYTTGGYSEVHVISPGNCDYSPEEYREAYAWVREMEAE